MNRFPFLTEGYRQSVLPLVHDFFRYPIDYLDRSWLSDSALYDQMDRLMTKACSREPLSDWILNHFKLTMKVDCDFGEPYSRMALLSKQTLSHLLEHAGALIYSARIPREMEDMAMDEDLYRFAVSKAPFLSRQIPEYCMTKLINDWSNEQLVRQALISAGLNLLAVALTGMPDSVTSRIALKLPKESGRQWQVALEKQARSNERIQESRRLLLKLYREVDPTCSLL